MILASWRSWSAAILNSKTMVNTMETERKRLDIAPKVDRTVAPSSGFAEMPNEAEVRATSFLTSIISARQEAQLLFELAQTLGNSLSLKETLSVVAIRLKEMIPHDCIVFFVCQEGMLIPEYVHGADYELILLPPNSAGARTLRLGRA